jgi:hypothetical protein
MLFSDFLRFARIHHLFPVNSRQATYSFRPVFAGFVGIDNQAPALYAGLDLKPPQTALGVAACIANIAANRFACRT